MTKKTLTTAAVERLKPPAAGQVEHRDAAIPASRCASPTAAPRAGPSPSGARPAAPADPRHLAEHVARRGAGRLAPRPRRPCPRRGPGRRPARGAPARAGHAGRAWSGSIPSDTPTSGTNPLAPPERTLELHVLPTLGDRAIEGLTRRDILDLLDDVGARVVRHRGEHDAEEPAAGALLGGRPRDRQGEPGGRPAAAGGGDRARPGTERRRDRRPPARLRAPRRIRTARSSALLLLTGQRLQEVAGMAGPSSTSPARPGACRRSGRRTSAPRTCRSARRRSRSSRTCRAATASCSRRVRPRRRPRRPAAGERLLEAEGAAGQADARGARHAAALAHARPEADGGVRHGPARGPGAHCRG